MKKYALAIDLAFILLFVGIGRSAHQHGDAQAGMLSTTWPFAIGLLVGWLVVWRSHRATMAPNSGLIIVLVTVVLGMTFRVVSGQGIAFAFVLVALAFLSLFLVGWRIAVGLAARRR